VPTRGTALAVTPRRTARRIWIERPRPRTVTRSTLSGLRI
jgi:hypothetical protein